MPTGKSGAGGSVHNMAAEKTEKAGPGPKPTPASKGAPGTKAGAEAQKAPSKSKMVPAQKAPSKSKMVPAQKAPSKSKMVPAQKAPSKSKMVPAQKAPSKSGVVPSGAKKSTLKPPSAPSRSTRTLKVSTSAPQVHFSASTGGGGSDEVERVSSVPDLGTDFERTFQTLANNMYPAQKYVSRATGLEVLHVEVPGPVLNAYLVLGTYPLDNDGLPHCLEHLVFLGSQDYAYKGILDGIANKCMSGGTNAWTDSDHTCYTFETAGQDGFCCLLPIYLDHIFFPTLPDSGFLTEVHHITREGKDGGVVYSEMLAKQHSPENRSVLELTQALYPRTSPYHYNSGGTLKNLRTTTDNHKVRGFHEEYYTPRNLRIIVCGVLDIQRLFTSLRPVWNKLLAKNYAPFRHPVLDRAPAVGTTKTIPIGFPGDGDEDTVVTVAFLGPSMLTDLEAVIGLRLLLVYLSESAVSPLEQEFVESQEPLCSSVDCGHFDNAQPFFFLEFEGAEAEEAPSLLRRLRKVLQEQVEGFDMGRMAGVVLKASQEDMSAMENSPRDICGYAGILDFLFGRSDYEQFEAFMSPSTYKRRYLDYKAGAWTTLIKKHLLDLNWVTAVAVPSKEEQVRMARREASRIAQRKMKLGDTGLRMLHEELEAALAFNARPIPSQFLRNMAPEKETSISRHEIRRHENPSFLPDLGPNLFLDDINTNFLYVTLHMDTTSLRPELRKYLSLFREAFTESPMRLANGEVLPFLDVVTGLSRDLLNFSFSFGLSGGTPFKPGPFQHLFCCKAQMEMGKVDVGFEWLRKLVHQTIWDTARLPITIEKMMADITRLKRDGVSLATALMDHILYKEDSNRKSTNFIVQEMWLKELTGSLGERGAEVRAALEEIQTLLTDPSNMTLHIATSLERLGPVLESRALDWNHLLTKLFPQPPAHKPSPPKKLANAPDSSWMRSAEELEEGLDSTGHRLCLGLNAITSGFVTLGCWTDMTHYNHPDVPALNTAIHYFCQQQGPFVTGVRGGGYAYNVWMEAPGTEGVLRLQIFQCSNTVEAFGAVRRVVEEHVGGGREVWDEDLFLSAKSSLSFHLTGLERTPLKMAALSLQSYYRNTPHGHTQREIAQIQSLTLTDLETVTKKYFPKLFDQRSLSVVVCPTNRLSTVLKKFKKLGYEMEVLKKLGHAPLPNWNL